MKLFRFFLIFISVVSLGTGCKGKGTEGGNEKYEEKVLAVVNGVKITEDDVTMRLMGGHGAKITPEMEKKTLEDAIRDELLYQRGTELGLDKDPAYRRAVRQMKKRLDAFKRVEMARRVFNTQVAAKVNITDGDARKYYDANEEMMKIGLHLEMIQFTDRAQAEDALRRIRAGTTFEKMARERYPQAPKRQKQPWDLGFLMWDQIPFDWIEDAYRLKKGEVSGVIESKRTGVLILKLLDTKKNDNMKFDNLKGSIMNRLRDKTVMEAYDRYVQQLMQEAKIVREKERRNPLEQ